MAKIKYMCRECGSDNVLFDAWAKWNVETQEMELNYTYDNTYCENCDCECKVEEIEIETPFKARDINNYPFEHEI